MLNSRHSLFTKKIASAERVADIELPNSRLERLMRTVSLGVDREEIKIPCQSNSRQIDPLWFRV